MNLRLSLQFFVKLVIILHAAMFLFHLTLLLAFRIEQLFSVTHNQELLRPDQTNATCYKVSCDKIAFVWPPLFMLHATKMNMFIIVACSMLQIFSVVFVWPHHATESQENVRTEAQIFR